LGAQPPQRRTSATTFIASRGSATGVTAKVYRSPHLERNRSPPISYADIDDSTTAVTARVYASPHERTRSPISYADIDDLRDPGQTVLRNK